jgi:hypothetical protein
MKNRSVNDGEEKCYVYAEHEHDTHTHERRAYEVLNSLSHTRAHIEELKFALRQAQCEHEQLKHALIEEVLNDTELRRFVRIDIRGLEEFRHDEQHPEYSIAAQRRAFKAEIKRASRA